MHKLKTDTGVFKVAKGGLGLQLLILLLHPQLQETEVFEKDILTEQTYQLRSSKRTKKITLYSYSNKGFLALHVFLQRNFFSPLIINQIETSW